MGSKPFRFCLLAKLHIKCISLVLRYGVDAVGLFCVPAEGPHGFYSIGRQVLFPWLLPCWLRCTSRTLESLTRAMNNLIERLHASFFLYLLPEPFQFLSVASYLSAPLLIGASLTIAGLRTWHTAQPDGGLSALKAMNVIMLTGVLVWAVSMIAVSISSTLRCSYMTT